MYPRFLLLFLTLGLVSCASVSIEPGTQHTTQHKPSLVYVMPFNTTHGEFNVDRTGADLTAFQQNLQLMMKTAIVTDLSTRLVPAVAGTKADWSSQKNAWIVEGDFVLVNQGSRLLRGVVGFGAGGTKLETRVRVYDLRGTSGTPFLTFSTTGGSNAEPGAILGATMDPLTLAIGAVSGVAHGCSEDTKRTARMITAELSDYMYHHGWITQDKWIEPKTVGGEDLW